jgi:hypothetical protein
MREVHLDSSKRKNTIAPEISLRRTLDARDER